MNKINSLSDYEDFCYIHNLLDPEYYLSSVQKQGNWDENTNKEHNCEIEDEDNVTFTALVEA